MKKNRLTKTITSFLILFLIGTSLFPLPALALGEGDFGNWLNNNSSYTNQWQSTGTEVTPAPVPETLSNSESTANSASSSASDSTNTSTNTTSANTPSGTSKSSASSVSTPSSGSGQPGMFAKILGAFMSGIPEAITKVLQLKSIQELVYNQSDIFTLPTEFTGVPSLGDNVFGVFTQDTFNKVIKPMQDVFKGIAWTIALAMMYLAILQMARSGANSTRRVKLYATLENWVVGSVLIAGNVYLLDLIFGIATGAVKFLAPPSGTVIDFMQYHMPSSVENFLGQAIITPLIMIAILGVTFALNFIYLQRYFTLTVLIILAPIFSVMWFTDKTRGIFENWFKEIITLAAMPVTHALFLYIYYQLVPSGTVSPIAQLFFLILMVPMSDMVRGMLGAGGSGKGLNNNLLLGMGLGASLGLTRSLMSLGQVASGVAGGVAGAGSVASSVASALGSNVGMTNQAPGAEMAQVMGNNGMMDSFQQRIGAGRSIGGKVGRVFGGLSGAVFGAAMGNNMATAMGSMVGTQAGEGIGSGLGGVASIAGTEMMTHFKPNEAESFYENLGQGNIAQTQMGPDGTPVWQRDSEGQGDFSLDSNGHRIPVSQAVVSPDLARDFGKANFDSVRAQAYAGVPFAGRSTANQAVQSNAQAIATAQMSLPNPLQTSYGPGDMLQKVTTNSGSHFYKLGQEGARQYVYSTAESNPLATPENPFITESRFVTSKEGDLTEKVVRQGFSGNFATARGVQPALILNNMFTENN